MVWGEGLIVLRQVQLASVLKVKCCHFKDVSCCFAKWPHSVLLGISSHAALTWPVAVPSPHASLTSDPAPPSPGVLTPVITPPPSAHIPCLSTVPCPQCPVHSIASSTHVASMPGTMLCLPLLSPPGPTCLCGWSPGVGQVSVMVSRTGRFLPVSSRSLGLTHPNWVPCCGSHMPSACFFSGVPGPFQSNHRQEGRHPIRSIRQKPWSGECSYHP